MSAIHSATAGSLTRELVEAVLAEARAWTDVAVSQAAGSDAHKAAVKFAIGDLLTDLSDHLGIALSIVLATYGIDADGQR